MDSIDYDQSTNDLAPIIPKFDQSEAVLFHQRKWWFSLIPLMLFLVFLGIQVIFHLAFDHKGGMELAIIELKPFDNLSLPSDIVNPLPGSSTPTQFINAPIIVERASSKATWLTFATLHAMLCLSAMVGGGWLVWQGMLADHPWRQWLKQSLWKWQGIVLSIRFRRGAAPQTARILYVRETARLFTLDDIKDLHGEELKTLQNALQAVRKMQRCDTNPCEAPPTIRAEQLAEAVDLYLQSIASGRADIGELADCINDPPQKRLGRSGQEAQLRELHFCHAWEGLQCKFSAIAKEKNPQSAKTISKITKEAMLDRLRHFTADERENTSFLCLWFVAGIALLIALASAQVCSSGTARHLLSVTVAPGEKRLDRGLWGMDVCNTLAISALVAGAAAILAPPSYRGVLHWYALAKKRTKDRQNAAYYNEIALHYAENMRNLRYLLFTSAALLVCGVVGANALYTWPLAYISEPHFADKNPLYKQYTVLAHTFITERAIYYTIILAVTFLPAYLVLRYIAYLLADEACRDEACKAKKVSAAPGGIVAKEGSVVPPPPPWDTLKAREQWMQDRNLSAGSAFNHLPQLAAILAPLVSAPTSDLIIHLIKMFANIGP